MPGAYVKPPGPAPFCPSLERTIPALRLDPPNLESQWGNRVRAIKVIFQQFNSMKGCSTQQQSSQNNCKTMICMQSGHNSGSKYVAGSSANVLPQPPRWRGDISPSTSNLYTKYMQGSSDPSRLFQTNNARK